jgi:hypothetical protein
MALSGKSSVIQGSGVRRAARSIFLRRETVVAAGSAEVEQSLPRPRVTVETKRRAARNFAAREKGWSSFPLDCMSIIVATEKGGSSNGSFVCGSKGRLVICIMPPRRKSA